MAICDKFDASVQCTDGQSAQKSGTSLSDSALDLLKEGSRQKASEGNQSFDGELLNFDPTKAMVQAEVTPGQEVALGRLKEGKTPESSPSNTAIEAGTKMATRADAPGQPEIQKVSWEDNRTADLLGHDLWLLAGVTSSPAMFAQNVLKEFSTMPEEKLNLVADLLEKGAHHAAVKRDANGKVESISYNYDHIRMKEIFQDGIAPGLIVLPEALAMKAGRALNRGSGNDVTINFKNGETTLEARQYWDITGRGYFGGGSHRMSSPIQRANPLEYKPYWKRDA